MLFYQIWVITFIIKYSEFTTLQDYCAIDPENSPCKYKCVRGSVCGDTNEKYRSLTDAEREVVVQTHNEFREKVAKGEYNNINLPRAANMKVMSYDKECEFFAGCYIKQCVFEHDDLRVSLSKEYLGQNLYTLSAPQKIPLSDAIIKRGITSWFNEVKLISADTGTSLMKEFQMMDEIGHFTQLIWPTTEFVGCAMMLNLRLKGWYTYDLFCDYKPPGNQLRKPMYTSGELNCKANSKYPNLCGNIRPLSDDTYTPPKELGGGAKSNTVNGAYIYPLILVLSILILM